MIDVAILSVIRRWHVREGVSIREISRRTKLSRNTIRKHLASGALEAVYPKRRSRSKVDGYAELLASWLKRESARGRKERRNLKQLHGELMKLGYTGSYDRVAAFARVWRRQQQEASKVSRDTFVPLVFAPGEAFQFDWSEDWVVIGGERTKLMVAQFKLCHSRAFMLPQVVNARFKAMVSHFLFEAEFCTPGAGWEKGQIEKNVRDARPRLFHDAPEFAGFRDVNVWLERRCRGLWDEIHHPEQPQRTVAEVWADEHAHLMRMPTPFDGFVEHTKRVSPACLIAFARNRYSVPAAFANRPVSVRVYAERIVIAAEGQVIAEHPRVIARGRDCRSGRTVYDWRHYLSVLQRKPGALRNGAPFAELPQPFKRLQAARLKRPGGDREMVEILALVLHHDEPAVLRAAEIALAAGAASKQHVLNILSRLLEASPPSLIDIPDALTLLNEPKADVHRYDRLRGDGHVI